MITVLNSVLQDSRTDRPEDGSPWTIKESPAGVDIEKLKAQKHTQILNLLWDSTESKHETDSYFPGTVYKVSCLIQDEKISLDVWKFTLDFLKTHLYGNIDPKNIGSILLFTEKYKDKILSMNKEDILFLFQYEKWLNIIPEWLNALIESVPPD